MINTSITLLVLSGAGLSQRIWHETFHKSQHNVVYLDYPNRGNGVLNKPLGLNDYSKHIIRQIPDCTDCEYILVAHSLGGMFINDVSEHLGTKLRGIITVGAIIKGENEHFFSDKPFPVRMLSLALISIFGTKPPDSALKNQLCNGLSEAKQELVISDFTPESGNLYRDKITTPLPNTPCISMIPEQDKSISVREQQNYASKMNIIDTVHFNSGHLPMLHDPEHFAQIIDISIHTLVNQ